ncbi:hypothetical protein D3C87_411750 [compost metagenome]
MKLFLSEKLTLHTSLSRTEALKKLRDNIGSPGTFLERIEDNRSFEGTITDNSFAIKRIINYKNSFLPIIKGEFSEMANGTKISLVMKPDPNIIKFMMLWLAGVFLGIIVLLFVGFTKEGSHYAALFPCGILAMGIGIITVCFNTERAKAKTKLIEILEAEVKKDL